MARETARRRAARRKPGDPPGLREQQKQDRRQRILSAARAHFLAHGFDSAIIERIAVDAGVSAVTVYNYYGSKLGLLLALVSESDQLLVEKIEDFIADPPASLVEAVSGYAAIIRAHALSFLTKPVWRQVIAASITGGGSEFGAAYAQLDRDLGQRLAMMLKRLRARGVIGPHPDLDALGDCLFNLQNARFGQFVSMDDLADDRVDALLRSDLAALLALSDPISRGGGRITAPRRPT